MIFLFFRGSPYTNVQVIPDGCVVKDFPFPFCKEWANMNKSRRAVEQNVLAGSDQMSMETSSPTSFSNSREQLPKQMIQKQYKLQIFHQSIFCPLTVLCFIVFEMMLSSQLFTVCGFFSQKPAQLLLRRHSCFYFMRNVLTVSSSSSVFLMRQKLFWVSLDFKLLLDNLWPSNI